MPETKVLKKNLIKGKNTVGSFNQNQHYKNLKSKTTDTNSGKDKLPRDQKKGESNFKNVKFIK